MPTHSIGISEHAFQLLMAKKAFLLERGFVFSNTRLIHYLLDFAEWTSEALAKVVGSGDSDEIKFRILKDAVQRAQNNKPMSLPRGGYKPSINATLEERILVTQQIEARLGIENAPRELVNYFLDNRDALHLRAAVRRREQRENEIEGLKMGEQPDTGAQP